LLAGKLKLIKSGDFTSIFRIGKKQKRNNMLASELKHPRKI